MYYFHAFTILVLSSLSDPASANCWNRFDLEDQIPPRLFTTCLGEYCIDDELEFECASASWMGAGFKGGLEINCTPEVSGEGYNQATTSSNCIYTIGEYELSEEVKSLLSCTPKISSDLSCSWFP